MNSISLNDVLSKTARNSFRNFKLKGLNVIKNAKVYDKHGVFANKTLFFSDNMSLSSDTFIKSVSNLEDVNVFDCKNNYITPTMIDQHIHGKDGIDFNKNSEAEIRSLLVELKALGHGEILASLTPDKINNLNLQMDVIRRIIKNPKSNETRISGINLEGPFFSPEKRGIHSEDMLIKPTVDEIKKLNLDDVKLVTIAPELDKDYEATNYLKSLGIIPSAGHCEASAEQVRNSGINCITHLFNGMVGYNHRIPTIVNEGLENDNIYIEVNTAFELLKPKTIDLIYKVKPHDKIILISDAIKGVKPGEDHFIMGDKRVNIEADGVARDEDGVLAGAIKSLGEVAKEFIDSTLLTFGDFIKFTTVNSRKLLNLDNQNYLNINKKPSFVIWDKDTLKPIKTFIKGE